MNEESSLPQPPPSERDKSFRKVMWLLAAFVPSALGVACFHLKERGRELLPYVVVVNLVISVAASVGLVRGMKNAGAQFILGLFLIPFFFVLNVLIVFFVGCSGMGRIGR